jgi:tetratricopeptide (TPR) repeat protein
MWPLRSRRPDVSVIVVVYNMAREAPRTLLSLSTAYQRHVTGEDYEVIVVDNGSTPPFDANILGDFAGDFRLIRMDSPHPSPAFAVNRGLAEARGNILGVLVDGARIVTPGLLHFSRHGARMYSRAAVTALTWHLGFDMQGWAIEAGYSKEREDALLASIDWPLDGYRLFEISTLAGSSTDGWFLPPSESNALFMLREAWDELGGFDERFDAPGGGLVNLDTWRRVLELPGMEQVTLLGEGTFHQLHGGIATNAAPRSFVEKYNRWAAQYEAIRGRPWRHPEPRSSPTYIGTLPRPALARFVRAALDPVRARLGEGEPPLGVTFDRQLWSATPVVRPADPTAAALVDLADKEFAAGAFEAAAAVARLAREHAPDEPEPLRLLAQAGAWLPGVQPPKDRRAEVHAALGDAYRIAGNSDRAASEYRAALAINSDLVRACIGLSMLRMPGDDYSIWLQRFHALLTPATYLEIGVGSGRALAMARPPTRALGVDPAPKINALFKAETYLFAETSDEFFARKRLAPLLDGHPLALAFIDGAHSFEQALRDFINVEGYCGARSMMLIHDTIPLDELSQRRERQTAFYSGDVWKTVLCLRHYRPDLEIFTIATPWTGLTVVTGLDSTSRVLAEHSGDAIGRFVDSRFEEVESRFDVALNIVPNEWDGVVALLKKRDIL